MISFTSVIFYLTIDNLRQLITLREECPNPKIFLVLILKFDNKDTRTMRLSGVLIVNFEHISHLVLVFLVFNSNAGKYGPENLRI